MIITILNVSYEKVPTAKGSYGKLDVAYKNEQGKTEGKKIMSFTNEVVFNTIRAAVAGESFNITMEKDDKNYWQWTSATPATGGAVPVQEPIRPVAGATASPRSTYETPEERAKKQVYIVRQSSISSALEYSKSVKALKTVEDVIKVAQQFEAFVFGEKYDDGTVFTMKDDADQVIQ